MTKMLSVSNLGKSFKNNRVLDNVSFDVRQGEIMAVLGPNGAGKSTTIRSIMGIIFPDEGEVTFHQTNSKGIPREIIGYLPEERGLYKNVKVMDMLLYLAELKNYPLDRARDRALHYLKKFDLEGKENTAIEELSKGMGQKVQFISSILHEPELLILDEPFSGLDPVSQDLFRDEIRQLANDGTAILLSSHQMNLVEEMCDRLFMMHQGKRVVYGPLDEVKTEYANFKCTMRGSFEERLLQRIPQVEQIETINGEAILYLEKDIHPASWLSHLPEQLNIQELSIDRISLHEIFVQIATGERFTKEGELHAK